MSAYRTELIYGRNATDTHPVSLFHKNKNWLEISPLHLSSNDTLNPVDKRTCTYQAKNYWLCKMFWLQEPARRVGSPLAPARRSEARWDRWSEARWDRRSESRWDRRSDAGWDRRFEAGWDRWSEARWDRQSEASWDQQSEVSWDRWSEDRRGPLEPVQWCEALWCRAPAVWGPLGSAVPMRPAGTGGLR